MTSLAPLPESGQLDFARNAQRSAEQRRAIEAAAASGDKTEIRKVAEDFEATFLSQMLNHMFKNVGDADGMFGGGHGEEVWKGQYIETLGQSLARNGGIGVADVVERQLLELQNVNAQENR